MAKRFALISFGILCLMLSAVAGFHIGTGTALSGPIYFPNDGVITHFAEYMLDENGQAWLLPGGAGPVPPDCWTRLPEHDVPSWLLSQIKFWHLTLIVGQDNTAWRNVAEGLWESCGPWPGGPVPTESGTIGEVKNIYSGED